MFTRNNWNTIHTQAAETHTIHMGGICKLCSLSALFPFPSCQKRRELIKMFIIYEFNCILNIFYKFN